MTRTQYTGWPGAHHIPVTAACWSHARYTSGWQSAVALATWSAASRELPAAATLTPSLTGRRSDSDRWTPGGVRRREVGCQDPLSARLFIWCRWVDTVAHLRRWANEAWPGCTRSIFHAAENSGDSVGFGEECGIADSEWRAQAEPPQGADGRRGFGQKEESHGVGHEDSREENVTKLSARSFHQRCVVVSDKDPEHQTSAHEPVDGGWGTSAIHLEKPGFSF